MLSPGPGGVMSRLADLASGARGWVGRSLPATFTAAHGHAVREDWEEYVAEFIEAVRFLRESGDR